MIFKLAWRNLWRNKRRTFITAASVFFAVLLAIVMNSLQTGAYERMIHNVVSFYTGYVQLHQQGYWDEQTLENSFAQSDSLKHLIQTQKHVTQVVPRLESFALASSSALTKGCLVVGIDPENEHQLTRLGDNVVAGDYLDAQSSQPRALVATGLAEKLDLQEGDTLILLGQGYRGVSAAGKYAISGLVQFGSPELNQTMVYLPLDEAQYMYGAYQRLTSYVLQIAQPDQTPEIVARLENKLSSEAYEVMSWREMMPEVVQMMKADKAGNVITLAVLYLIIAFGMFGTVLMMLAERKHELGIMLAIGMKKAQLGFMLTIELFLIAVLGIFLGMITSLPILIYFHHNPIHMGAAAEEAYATFGMEAVLPASLQPGIFFTEALTVLIFTLLIITYPYIKILRMKPLTAMHR